MQATAKTLATFAVMVATSAVLPARAGTVTSDAAFEAAKGWVNLREAPGAPFDASANPTNVAAYAGEGGTGTYYVVSFEGGGYVATSGDTAFTPVLAFSRKGAFDADPENPRVKMLRFAAAAESPSSAIASANAAKWARLRAAATGAGSRRLAASSRPSGGVVCVSPMLKTAWSQRADRGENYYNPYNAIISGANAPCGCVATAGAQLMYYWKWPSGTNVVAAGGFYASIKTSDGSLGWNAYDGYRASSTATEMTPWNPAFGGPYDWANMKATGTATTATQKKAVGRLTRDVGIATYMTWSSGEGSSPGSIFGHRLVDTFAYANAKIIGGWNENSRDAMLASLDAGMPCFVNLSNHAVVADGYGYAADGTLYVHYNYGWGNIGDEGDSDDTWYTMEVGSPGVSIASISYNVYPPSVGAPDLTVVSGVVSNGAAVAANAVVTATERTTGFATNVTATSAGRYFFMLPQGCYTFVASSSDGAKTATCAREVKVCVSAVAAGAGGISYGGSSGNIHGLNFALAAPAAAVAPALAHRWSFESGYSDSKGGADATAVGSVAVKDGQAVLSGSGHGAGYINLGTGLLNTTAATLEIWASQDAAKNWSRVFDYGSSSSDYFMLAWTYESQLVRDAVGGKVGGTGGDVSDTMAPYELGVKYHIAVTFERQPDGSTFIRWMRRDADTGLLQKQGAMILAGGIHSYATPSLYLGYSQFGGDSDANASYDEVRVWDGVLSDAVLASHAKAGPDEESPSATVASSVARYVATAVWQGGTAAPTAAALETASNWSVAYSDGTTGNAVPGEKTTVVIPSGATAFSIPSGYTPNWKALQLGTPGSKAQWGVISGASINANTFKDTALTSYTLKGDGDPAYLGHAIIHNPEKKWPAELQASLIRYDGWIDVSAAQAGTWFFRQDIDDYLALVIDGRYVLVDRCCVTSKAAVEMTPGWHRFTYIVGDGSGDYWGRAFPSDHSVTTPLVVSVNGGPEYAFGDRHFTLGSSAVASVTLSADCDWRAFGEIAVDCAAIDLDGHELKIDTATASGLGATVKNGTLVVYGDAVDTSNLKLENVTVESACAEPTSTSTAGYRNTLVDFATEIENAVIRYTTDGSDPTEESAVYTPGTAISVTDKTGATTVKARVYADGYYPSDVFTQDYYVKQFFGPTNGANAATYEDNAKNRALHWVDESEATYCATGVWNPATLAYANGGMSLSGFGKYVADAASRGRKTTVEFELSFATVYDDEGAGEGNLANAKGAVRLGTGGCFQIYTLVNGTKTWLDVAAAGVAPVDGATYTVRLVFDSRSSTYTAAVVVEGEAIPLAASGVTAFGYANPSTEPLQAFGFDGDGVLQSIKGWYPAPAGAMIMVQ